MDNLDSDVLPGLSNAEKIQARAQQSALCTKTQFGSFWHEMILHGTLIDIFRYILE